MAFLVLLLDFFKGVIENIREIKKNSQMLLAMQGKYDRQFENVYRESTKTGRLLSQGRVFSIVQPVCTGFVLARISLWNERHKAYHRESSKEVGHSRQSSDIG